MSAYSMDLRLRIVEAYENGEGSYQTLAHRFKVDKSTVYRYLKRHRERGSVAPTVPTKKGPDPVLNPNIVRQLWQELPDATEQELVEALMDRASVRVHRSTVGRMLKKLGLTRKKSPSPQPSRTTTRSSTSSTRSPSSRHSG